MATNANNIKKNEFLERNKSKEDLAEIIGIMLGDGCLHKDKRGRIHTTISCNKLEKEYAIYLKELFSGYFHQYSFQIVNATHEFLIRNISTTVGRYLVENGLKIGNKIKSEVDIPPWIFENDEYLRRCLRGLFDTDGCVYNKYDNYAQIEFKFHSRHILESTRVAVVRLSFNPTKIQEKIEMCKGKKHKAWKFYLSRQKEIEQFLNAIKPKNEKHMKRYQNIKTRIKYGRGGNRTPAWRFGAAQSTISLRTQ